jgi:hypothetical protein
MYFLSSGRFLSLIITALHVKSIHALPKVVVNVLY